MINQLKLLKKYLKESLLLMQKYPHSFNIKQLVKYYRIWSQSNIDSEACPLVDEKPWITFSSIEFLEKILTKDMIVYEYGTGGSTLFFAKRAKKVYSVEHDKEWFERVSKVIEQKGYKNWHGVLSKPISTSLLLDRNSSDLDNCMSSSPEFQGQSFKSYVTNIDLYPDSYFDLIFIDGRARCSCFKQAISKIKNNGYIVWDNTDRQAYFQTIQEAPRYLEFIDFPGASPYVDFFTRTSVWKCSLKIENLNQKC